MALLASCAGSDPHFTEPAWPRIDTSAYSSTVAENALRGDSSWYVPPAGRAPHGELSVWASPYAVTIGDSVDVFVNATAGPVNLYVYRLGWYHGLGSRLSWHAEAVPAWPQRACTAPFVGPVECYWSRTLRVPTPRGGASGIYLIKVSDKKGLVAFYPFVVRSPRPARIAVVVPQFTWQAYNLYGGAGLYTQNPGSSPNTLNHVVSFERPYWSSGGAAELFDPVYSLELLVARWLERNAYDVSYVSDADLANIAQPLVSGARVLVFAGHDEYWTWSEFDRVQRLRDDHVHLMFFSGNDAYWNIRLSPGSVLGESNDVITCYKSANDPGASSPLDVTTKFRDPPLNRPENSLLGVMYVRGSGASNQPLVVADSNLKSTGAEFLASAHLRLGDSVQGVVGTEGDRVVPNRSSPRSLQVLFKTPVVPKVSETSTVQPYYYTTFYVAPSGAGVFASGTNDYAQALDSLWGSTPSPKLQALTKSVLGWMLAH